MSYTNRVDLASRYGWQAKSLLKGGGFEHPDHPGHTLQISNTTGAWHHKTNSGMVKVGGKGDAGFNSLKNHLTKFHSIQKEDVTETVEINSAFSSFLESCTNTIVSADGPENAPYETLVDPEHLTQLNAVLGATVSMPFINPYVAVQRLRNKLTTVGCDFKDPVIAGQTGKVSEPLTQWGNITRYHLVIQWVLAKGFYTLDAHVDLNTSVASGAPPTINESPLDEAAKKYAIRITKGDGSRVYSQAQGKKTNIKGAVLHGSTLTNTSPKGQIIGKGTGTQSLRKHLTKVHKREKDHKTQKGRAFGR